MPFTEEKEDGNILLKITEALSIYEAAALREAFLGCLGTQGEVALDISGITGCDAAGLQLLCSLRKSAARLGKPMRVVGSPPPVLDALAAAGLASNEIL